MTSCLRVKHPGTRGVRTARRAGFTLIELMIVVAIIGMLSAAGAMAIARARFISGYNACLNNLNQINRAKVLWALQSKTSANPTEDDLFGSAAYIRVKPKCPAGGTYEIKALDDDVTCTIEGHFLH